METAFSFGSVLRLYNEDPKPAEKIIEGVSLRRQSTIIEKRWKSVELQECGYEKKTSSVL
jgi:hypothetical protein